MNNLEWVSNAILALALIVSFFKTFKLGQEAQKHKSDADRYKEQSRLEKVGKHNAEIEARRANEAVARFKQKLDKLGADYDANELYRESIDPKYSGRVSYPDPTPVRKPD